MDAQIKQSYKKGKIEKGIAFPTCISVNHCVCHFSPLQSEDKTLATGDVVKIDLGVHIDGCIAVVGHTMTVGGAQPGAEKSEDSAAGDAGVEKITGPFADVMLATYNAAQVCLALLKSGNTNTMLTEKIAQVAEAYGVNPVQGVLMHQMKQFVIDGNKVIINKAEPDQNVEEITFEDYEVYAIDVCMSTGSGKPSEGDARTTVYKRAIDNKQPQDEGLTLRHQ